MRWDDPIFTGKHGQWRWIVVREMIRDLPQLASQCHIGQRLCIAAFDFGPISPSSDEISIGWASVDDVMISPPLTDTIDIPCAEHDEWYVFPSVPTAIDIGKRYVNYLGFTLADPKHLGATEHPTRDQTNLDWLVPLQLEFWQDMERLKPISYISSGDYDIIVTSNPNFAERVLSAAQRKTG